ncbi:MAG TPA: DUF3043 domain-containing protein [Propionibacteriaceae bacterium]|nr:DUF3043 domain-containing protein [Propionibacteriaceae bacterium]
MALFRRNSQAAEPEEPATTINQAPTGKKDRPTPTRKEAEAARRQRISTTLNKKEARAVANRQRRAERIRVISAREAAPEKVLMRDYIDARFNLGEFLLPSVVVILAVTILGSYWPQVTLITTLAMYLFIAGVIVDGYLMWRRFKKVLAARLPKASTKGLLMYGMTRSTQIRRFRSPPPRIKRGETY